MDNELHALEAIKRSSIYETYFKELATVGVIYIGVDIATGADTTVIRYKDMLREHTNQEVTILADACEMLTVELGTFDSTRLILNKHDSNWPSLFNPNKGRKGQKVKPWQNRWIKN